MLKVEQVYPSDLRDQQWACIHKLIPEARTGGRPRSTDVRQVLNAIFYINRSGCAWRYLPKQYPKWQTVYSYYAEWTEQSVIKKIHDFLVKEVRKKANRNQYPSALIVDCQSVKAHWGEQRGYDGFKKVQGRKRSIIVDTLGLIHGVRVCTAQRGDAGLAVEMLNPQSVYFPATALLPLNAFYADAGYRGYPFQNAVQKTFGILPTLRFAKTQRTCFHNANKNTWSYRDVVVESNLKPVRWIVERTFAWFSNYRRLARDHEKKTARSEAMIHVGMIQLMFARLHRTKPYFVNHPPSPH